jgi:hypothetical protein
VVPSFFFFRLFLKFAREKQKNNPKKIPNKRLRPKKRRVPLAVGAPWADCFPPSRVIGALFEALTRQPCWILGILVAVWQQATQQATQQTVDFQSKWYQQAAAIREKHKVSLSFKPWVVYCFLFCLFILFVFLFFWFDCLFVCFCVFNYLLVSSKMKRFAS